MSTGDIQHVNDPALVGSGQPQLGTKNVFVEAQVVNNSNAQLMRTQAEQNIADDEERRKVLDDLIQSWEDRLQQISVITTFFASIEAGLLTMTTPDSVLAGAKGVLRASNTFLVGALVMHVYAAILSFLAGFLLTGFKLTEANKEEAKIEDAEAMAAVTAGEVHIKDIEKNGRLVDEVDVSFLSYHNNRNSAHSAANTTNVGSPTPGVTPRNSKFLPHLKRTKVVSSKPHMERSGLLFKHGQPSHLLSRFHGVCILIASVGFVCAMLGIIMYAWALHPTEVAAFATACFGVAIISGMVILAPV